MAFNLLNGDIVQVVAWQEQNSETVLNVLHYKLEVASSITDGAGEVNALVDKLTDATSGTPLMKKMRDAQTTEISHTKWTGQLIHPTRRPVQVTGVNLPGLLAGSTLPQNTAATITKQPDLPGRGRQGSLHLGGQPSAEDVGGIWDQDHMARLAAVADEIIRPVLTDANGGQWVPILFNQATPGNSRTVVAAYAQETIRVQRRRTVRVGI